MALHDNNYTRTNTIVIFFERNTLSFICHIHVAAIP